MINLNIKPDHATYFYTKKGEAFRELQNKGLVVKIDTTIDVFNPKFYTIRYYYVSGIKNFWRRTSNQKYEVNIKVREFGITISDDAKTLSDQDKYKYISQIQLYKWQIKNQAGIKARVDFNKKQLEELMFATANNTIYFADKSELVAWLIKNEYVYGYPAWLEPSYEELNSLIEKIEKDGYK